jgi:hypothetical protein
MYQNLQEKDYYTHRLELLIMQGRFLNLTILKP